jgi:Ni/Fe-hydrogenase subunit HybB-like protein
MLLYSFIQYQKISKNEFLTLTIFLKKVTLVSIIALASYEATAFLFIDKKWANIVLFGNFKYDFYIYVIFAIALPFGLLSLKLIKKEVSNIVTIIASILIIIGTYIGRLIFVYGGNAYPMSDRFGTGFEKYGEYEIIKDFIFFSPTLTEIFIVIGSVGVVILAYTVLDKLFSVSKIRDHH